MASYLLYVIFGIFLMLLGFFSSLHKLITAGRYKVADEETNEEAGVGT